MRPWLTILLFLPLLFWACGGTVIPTDPVKEMKKKFVSKHAYTILLADMDLREEQFYHKYKIIEFTKEGKLIITTTEWEKVSDDFFELHESNLGMELLSKLKTGKYNNLISPPGFTNIIGDSVYGKFKEILTEPNKPGVDGTVSTDWSFNNSWRFHPEYSYLEKELGLQGLKIDKAEYEQFKERFLFNRPFYGEAESKDSTHYGTYSRHWLFLRPDFYQRKLDKKNFEKIGGGSSDGFNRGGGGHGK